MTMISWYIGLSPLLLPLILADPATASAAATRATPSVVRPVRPVLTGTCTTFTDRAVDIGIGDKDDAGNATDSVSPSLLCLRSLNPRSQLYIQTLLRSRKKSNIIHTLPSIIARTYDDDDDDDEFDDCKKELDYCWTLEPKTILSPHDPQDQKQKRYRRRKRQRQSLIKLASSSTITDVIINNSSSNKIRLFLTSVNFRKNDIALPPLIAELVQPRARSIIKQSDDDDHSNDNDNNNDESSTHSILSPSMSSSTSSSLSQSSLDDDDQSSFRSNPLINLTGRWRSVITNSDLNDYDSFLKACCSDTITYWTRQLLTSSSIVSRQELIVKQSDGGRVMEFVDVHPLSSNDWNRTIMTSSSNSSSGISDSGISSRSSGTINANDDGKIENTNNYRPYVNRLTDPSGDPILVEAYWRNNGTVHTTLSRKFIASDNDNDDENNPIEWIEMNRYLLLKEEQEHNHRDNNIEEERGKTRILVCETIFYSMSSPPSMRKVNGDIYNTPTIGQADAMAKMTWRWEDVS
ncbi:MAG: hypothetical protein ACI8RD_007258 [Bacillariaceae sp.]|jgi:hypothetical protein